MAIRDIANNKFTRAAVLGAALLYLPFSTASADNDNNTAPVAQKVTVGTQSNDPYRGLKSPVQAPTADRPYYYARYDQNTAKDNSYIRPHTTATLNSDKLVVLNFIDERSPYSQEQTEVLANTLAAESKNSAKPLMLIDIVTVDANGANVNLATYATYYANNRLGDDFSKKDDYVFPYAVIYGTQLNGSNQYGKLFDYSIVNNAQSSADIRENKGALEDTLSWVVDESKKLATANTSTITLVAN